MVHTTHPLILLPLTFLVSATAKRDPVGRNPKRRLWAEAALNVLNTARDDIERMLYFGRVVNHHCIDTYANPSSAPLWASLADRDEIIQHTVRLTADLLCELVVVRLIAYHNLVSIVLS